MRGYRTFSPQSYIFIFLFLAFWVSIRLINFFSTKHLCITQTEHTREGFTGRVISLTLKPLSDNTQHSQEDLHAVSRINTSISANEQWQIHSLDHAAT